VSGLDIRPAEEGDLPLLTRAMRQEDFFAKRIEQQAEGHGVLLVAWEGAAPVGAVYVWLGPAEEPEVRRALPDVPLLVRLHVPRGHRNRGIGTRIIGAAERLVRQRGHTRVALGVGIDNIDAKRLYHRLSYREWAHEPISGPDRETFTMLVKDLPGTAGRERAS
jgi:GNAT superfamily N-acetyltransferase